MFSRASQHRTGLDLLYRGVALFFLLFTCVDLTSQTCAEESFGLPPAAWSRGAEDSAPEAPEPAHVEEDCFCCCSHLVVDGPYVVASLPDGPGADVPLIAASPSSPSRDFYHPPRTA
jgi:hypothetical protein